jgi:hypothetical protein
MARRFIMSFKETIQSVGDDESTMAKSFVMAISVIARTWYSTLDARRIRSWVRELMLENFQGNYNDPITSGHLFAMK